MKLSDIKVKWLYHWEIWKRDVFLGISFLTALAVGIFVSFDVLIFCCSVISSCWVLWFSSKFNDNGPDAVNIGWAFLNFAMMISVTRLLCVQTTITFYAGGFLVGVICCIFCSIIIPYLLSVIKIHGKKMPWIFL